ncbi:MAG: hypothetical protein H6672_14320 [Anaerolineaceae bacterium]|nr:hypothetical protein [Anaerolineaceae bacterium]
MENPLILSIHAEERAGQENLSDDDILFVRKHGYKLPNAGVVFRQLRRDRIPVQLPGSHRYRQLVGTTVVLCPTCESFVITVYRNEAAFGKDKKKRRYNQKRQVLRCPYCGTLHKMI